MGQGRPKQFEKMVPYMTRLQEETRLMAEALVATSNKFGGQRELFEEMLRLYQRENPSHYEKAKKFMELKKDE
ncbi:hypothetical protein G3M81_12170 [Bacillus paralicheniformis]|uniref:hypothetical protein n=1 Tax=Bacillus TaxID=1386 RepID=UPI0013EF49A3|nr:MULTISPECIES: hypothetical protein [Bacillus]MCY8609859.1 hypothetical protein [Bacillus haynesii]MEC0756426.1 hypothetical protein [Bacillus haynesii]QII49448.1 hypothetical protein G3M81_12170 [Bacillus paralicheniformis]